MKGPAKSKTNIIQVPAILLVTSSLLNEDVRKLFCENGDVILGIHIFLTIIMRNWKSNISIKGVYK